ncbi:MAG: hypothetical protein HC897_05575 [Thermoanaerobaculia bacterium]|nr:hypothetical protein [Thermoanaerobaculia bacterium]
MARWKYLGEWLFLVRRALLHHELPRPGSRESDFFDLVTFDDSGKVLHLGQRVARITPECLQAFVDRVVEAKLARKKTGDVGGAFLVAPVIEEAALAAYDKAVNSSSGSWFGLEESFTGYEGFVRVGPRRGFHLLLVEEHEGDYVPVLPA